MATGGRRYFLVERYLPSLGAGEIVPAVRRLGEARPEAARHLYTVYVPDEETCLSVFEASDAAMVEAANERARFHLDRIVEVELIPPPRGGEE
jgi:hypothetical protein